MNGYRTLRTLTAATAILGMTLLIAWPTPPQAQADDPSILPTAELLAAAADLPPSSLFILAMKLFGEGRRDEAVKWFYVAQIRGRFRLAVEPNLPPDGEPAVYEALFETIGPVINGWAFGDIPGLAARMNEALDWDATHANGLTPKTPNMAALERVRSGLVQFRDSVTAQRDDIKKERAANGLENR